MSNPALILTIAAIEPTSGRSQSMLWPAGPASAQIAWLWWLMFIVYTAIFAAVTILLLVAIFRSRSDRPPLGPTAFIFAGGIALPVVVSFAFLLTSLKATLAIITPQGLDPADVLTIRITGHRWWWEVEYPDLGIVTANEVQIPAGRPVRLELTSADVIHSFWAPRLHGKMDLIPGRTNTLWLQASERGLYRGQCAEYCGLQHAHMAFFVVALDREEFDAWAQKKRVPPTQGEPLEPLAARGREVFMAVGCKECHAIRGTQAIGNTGPDLTHIGSRRSLGAGTLPNTRGGMAAWVADPQAFKPGNLMPRTELAPEELQAVVAYLRSLE